MEKTQKIANFSSFSIHKNHFKGFSRAFLMSCMVLVAVILSIGMVSAWEWDNIKSYDEETGVVTISNSFLQIFPLGKVAEVYYPRVLKRFDTGEGDYQRIVEWDLKVYENYPDFAKDMNFLNMHLNEIIEKDYQLKYRVQVNETQVPYYYMDCDEKGGVLLPNGSTQNPCVQKIKEYKTSYEYEWHELGDKLTTLPSGNITIGLYVDIKDGDEIDAIPVWFGLTLDEYVRWDSSGLETGLSAYFTLNETAVAWNSRNRDNKNGTNVGANSIAGKLSTAYNCSGTDYIELKKGHPFFSGSAGPGTNAISLWIYPKEKDGSDWVWSYIPQVDNPDIYLAISGGNFDFRGYDDGGDQWRFNGDAVSEDTWQHVIMQWNTTTVEFWVNGDRKQQANVGNLVTEEVNGNHRLCNKAAGTANTFLGIIDEVGIWNGTVLTPEQIADLYNGGDGITYQQYDVETVLHTPINNYNSTLPTVQFNCSAYSGNIMQNITLRLNNGTSYTVTGGSVTNISLQKNYTMAQGNHSWNCTAYDTTHSSATSGNRNFTVDSIPPDIKITKPLGNIDFVEFRNRTTLNWTASDSGIGLSSCWYVYNASSNKTVTCSEEGAFFIHQRWTNITLYANDTFGNLNYSYSDYGVGIMQNVINFQNETAEGDTERFQINVTTNGTTLTIGKLWYNGTAYTGSISSLGGNNYSITKSIAIPIVTADVNVTFFWQLFLKGYDINTTEHNQTIRNLGADDCTAYGTLILNLTLKDEQNKTKLNQSAQNVSIKIDLDISPLGSTTPTIEYYKNYTEINPAQVCLSTDLSNSSYRMDAQIQYSSASREVEFYYIQNNTLSNSSIPNNIDLYDLLSDSSQVFVISYKDSNFLAVNDALIQIQRKYVEDGLSRTVEQPKTNPDGEVVAHLETNDVIAICQNPTLDECVISLNSFSSSIAPTDYTTNSKISFTMDYNETTRTVETIFTIPSGSASTVLMNVTMFHGLGNDSVCNDVLTSSSGTLSCSIPQNFGNGTVIAKVSVDGTDIGYATISLEEPPENIYGRSITFLGVLVLLTVVGVGISSHPAITAIFIGIGMFSLVSLNIINTGTSKYFGYGATILWIVIIIIIMMIKGRER